MCRSGLYVLGMECLEKGNASCSTTITETSLSYALHYRPIMNRGVCSARVVAQRVVVQLTTRYGCSCQQHSHPLANCRMPTSPPPPPPSLLPLKSCPSLHPSPSPSNLLGNNRLGTLSLMSKFYVDWVFMLLQGAWDVVTQGRVGVWVGGWVGRGGEGRGEAWRNALCSALGRDARWR